MILGIGIDFLENRRVEQELSRSEWRLGDGVFTQNEIAFCSSATKPAFHYAACFAVKEATLKALGLGVGDLAILRDVELGPGPTPEIILHNRAKTESEQQGTRRIWVSITRSRIHTGALVVVEG